MNNPWISKRCRMLLSAIIFGVGILTLPDFFLLGAIFIGIAAYTSFGIDMRRTDKAKKNISKQLDENNVNESIQFIHDSFLPGSGRGHLAITDRWAIFLNRNGGMDIAIQLKDIDKYGYKNMGTGVYQTTFSGYGSMQVGTTAEGKVPVLYLEGANPAGEFNYIISTGKNKAFCETIEHALKHGIVSKEIKQQNNKEEEIKQNLHKENEIILNQMNLIMDEDLNELDIANNYFLQNLKNYQEVVYETWTDRIMKLNSLTNSEVEKLNSYLFTSSLRGHRSAIAILKENNVIDQMDTKVIPSNLIYNILKNVKLPQHPAIKKIGYSQYKYYRNLNIGILTEEEILAMTEEYIQIGFKNTVANFLALKEFSEQTEKPA